MSSTNNNLPFPLVQSTWARVVALGEGDAGFGHNFYKNLFTDYPILLERDFKGVSIKNQERNLPNSITKVLSILDDMPRATEALAQLGMRHVAYGTQPAAYGIVGANVIKTLQQILGSHFTEEAKAEWLTLYGVIQKVMIDAAESDRAAPYRRKFYKRRAGEFKAVLGSVDSSALSSKIGITFDLRNVADSVINDQNGDAIAQLSASLSAEQRRNFGTALSACLENLKGAKLTANDQYILEWFVAEVQANKTPSGSSSSSSSSSSSGKCEGCSNYACVALLVGAAAVGAWFLFGKLKQ